MDTRAVGDLRVHPRASVVPDMDPDAFNEFAADIERRGIQTPLDILDDGTVVDGRHRRSAAIALGIGHVPVRVISPDDPFDYMVRAALMRRDLSKSQRAMLALHLPEFQKAKAEAAERRTENLRQTDTNVRLGETPTPTRAADAIAPLVGVSGSYIRKAALVAERSPELAERVASGEVTVSAAAEYVTGRSETLETRKERAPTPEPKPGRITAPKRTRPVRPWSRHFTNWCRAALPEDRPVLLDMAREIDQALSRIGATR